MSPREYPKQPGPRDDLHGFLLMLKPHKLLTPFHRPPKVWVDLAGVLHPVPFSWFEQLILVEEISSSGNLRDLCRRHH